MTLARQFGAHDNRPLVHFGSPRGIYENLVNLCMAGRLGVPRLNTVPADLLGNAPASAKTVGLRPEHLSQGDGKGASLMQVEHLGRQTLLHLRLDGHDIITFTDTHSRLAPVGQVGIKPRNRLCFDVKNEHMS